ncbi:hypothetical protein [Corynebacterium mayonis]
MILGYAQLRHAIRVDLRGRFGRNHRHTDEGERRSCTYDNSGEDPAGLVA